MLTGKSGERIVMCTEQNGHLLTLGMSGSGKSYYIYRRLEELWQAGAGGRRYVILDHSNSYTADEMKKADFSIDGDVFYFDLSEEMFTVFLGKSNDEDTGRMIQNILMDLFKVKAFRQRKILLDYCMDFVRTIKGKDAKPLSGLFARIERDIVENKIEDRGKRSETLKLLERLEILEQCRIQISRYAYIWKEGVHVIQLSGLSHNEKNIYVNLLLSMFWYQVKNMKTGFFTTYIVDEFQHLDLSVAVEEFLREGRKFGVSIILSSQYVGEGQKKYMPALKQPANQMFFRPVDSDVKALAELIDSEHVQEWRKILSGLQIGQAVLVGNYRVNDNTKVLQRPIVVNVQRKIE